MRFSAIMRLHPAPDSVLTLAGCRRDSGFHAEWSFEDGRTSADEAGVDDCERAGGSGARGSWTARNHCRHLSVGWDSGAMRAAVAAGFAGTGARADHGSPARSIWRFCGHRGCGRSMWKPGGTRSWPQEEGAEIRLLRDHDVLVQPGYFYDFESSGYIVLSLLTPPDVFREGVGRLRLAAEAFFDGGRDEFRRHQIERVIRNDRVRARRCGPCRPRAAYRRTGLRFRSRARARFR